jgi:hypothetical protein
LEYELQRLGLWSAGFDQHDLPIVDLAALSGIKRVETRSTLFGRFWEIRPNEFGRYIEIRLF